MNVEDLLTSIDALGPEFETLIATFGDEDEQGIRNAQAQYLGKTGKLSEAMKSISKLPPADRPKVGERVNRVKTLVGKLVEDRLTAKAAAAAKKDLSRSVDVTLPSRPVPRGSLHLLTQVQQEAVQIFAELGFVVAEGPQIETDWNTFEALGMHKDHPARDMQDTFYVSEEIVLRTHTSPVQIRTMLTQAPPIRIVAPGRVYRRDDDPTHSPMFTQIEGLAVDEGISFADLKGVLIHFVSRFFKKDLTVRLRPSYFPFVEPGAEVDMQCSFCGGSGCRLCKGSGWIEIGGAGVVDPVVLAHCNVDSEKYTGFAFGMGIERMAMLRHGVNDIKYYYEGDVRFLEQFAAGGGK